jgi:hypothetical protein
MQDVARRGEQPVNLAESSLLSDAPTVYSTTWEPVDAPEDVGTYSPSPSMASVASTPNAAEGADSAHRAPAATSPVVAAPAIEAAAVGVRDYGGCPAVIVEVFGDRAETACRVAWCESRWNPDATGAEGEQGLFQVHPRWHPDATYDPLGNALAAFRISSGGIDWSAWPLCK